MSHFTRSKVKIKYLDKLIKVAKEMGVIINQDKKTMTSSYAGTRKSEMVLEYRGGQAAVVSNNDGTYSVVMDNWNNPIVDKIGNDGGTLCRDYTVEVVRSHTMLMGGMITDQKVMNDGSVEIHISL